MGGKVEKKGADDAPCFNEIILKKLLVSYTAYSEDAKVRLSPDIITNIKDCLAENLSLTKLLVRPFDRDLKAEDKIKKALALAEASNDLEAINELRIRLRTMFSPMLLGPVMKPMNELQVTTCKSCIIIDTPIYYDDAVLLTNWLKMFQNKIKKIEIEDCCIQVDSLRKFSTVFNLQKNLTSICLDYNEFGDAGCVEICRGLQNNRTLLSLGLCYCGLTQGSGVYLGQILSTTALKELFLDGNDLRCYGCQDLIRVVSEEAEKMAMLRLMEKKVKMEEKARLREEGVFEPEEKKKKKGKKGGKKKKGEPAPVGPFVTKLHLADNGIDFYEEGGNKIASLKIIHDTIAMFVRLIEYSPEIEEIDIHNNTIGNMSATLVINALEMRRLKKVGSLAVRVSEKIDPDMFATILKLSKKVKKKKGGKRKK